ncbi:hypothetical protein INT43_004976 [Umbelopsis isabellina]|uniref:Alpha/beta hydrolase fold-3 domain-containing protein n=1 Tax=Mortierella isabellina TaxID=91625 RepID=A0A8H7UAE4_MORIS|nr:hypothetical protein INT43_004976 [Umbelopsis isabellina]
MVFNHIAARIRLFIVVRFLRVVFGSMSSRMARKVLAGTTKPKRWQHPWMQFEPKTKSFFVGRNIASQSREQVKQRLQNANVVIFYIHGGGFRVGKADMYMTTFVRWIKAMEERGLSCVIYSAEYRLAPEHKFPAAAIDCIESYRSIIEDYGVDPKKIMMGGDSAGGALSLETLYHTCSDVQSHFNQIKLPRPGSLLMVSPYTGDEDMGSAIANLNTDYISEGTREKMIEYLPHNKDIEAFSYHVKKVSYAQFLPHHIVVVVGGIEVLRDVGLMFAKRCREENLRVSVVREELPHDWAMLGRLFTADHKVIKRAVMSVVDLAQDMLNSNQVSA